MKQIFSSIFCFIFLQRIHSLFEIYTISAISPICNLQFLPHPISFYFPPSRVYSPNYFHSNFIFFSAHCSDSFAHYECVVYVIQMSAIFHIFLAPTRVFHSLWVEEAKYFSKFEIFQCTVASVLR